MRDVSLSVMSAYSDQLIILQMFRFSVSSKYELLCLLTECITLCIGHSLSHPCVDTHSVQYAPSRTGYVRRRSIRGMRIE